MMPESKAERPRFAGRADELEFLMGRLSQAYTGQGSCILISGAAGIGKTRLAEEFEVLASKAGFLVLVGKCLPGAPNMFLAFSEAIGIAREELLRRAESVKDAAIKGWLLDLADESGALLSEDLSRDSSKRVESSTFYFEVLNFLRMLSEVQPVLLHLDDLHWSDSNTVLLLHFLARNLRDSRVLLIGAFRPEDLAAKANEPPHPLSSAIEEMQKERIATEINLKPLQRAEIGQEIGSALRGEAEGELVRLVWQESEGNPLYALEIVRMLRDEEQISMSGDVWKVLEDLKPRVPPTVKDVILRRVDRLSPEKRALLEHAAVLGYDFDPSVLAELLGVPVKSMAISLGDLWHAHQLLAERQGRFAFEHDKIRQTVYERMSETRRAAIHLKVGEMLEARAKDELCGELAYHFYHGGQDAKCVAYALKAGEGLDRRYAACEARPYFQMALDRLAGSHEGEEGARRAHEGMGDVFFELRDYGKAVGHYEQCIPLCSSGSDRARLLRKTGECWWPTRLGKGSRDSMLSYFEQAEHCEGIEPFDRSEILSNRSVFAAWDGDLGRAVEYCEQAEELLRALDCPERLGLELINHLQLLLSIGSMEDARGVVDDLAGIYSRHPSPRGELGAENAIGYYFVHQGDLGEAVPHFAKSLELSEALGDYVEACWSHAFASLGGVTLNRCREALVEADLAKKAADDSRSPFMRCVAASLLVICDLGLNRFAEAQRWGQEVAESIQAGQWSTRTMMHGLANFALAELSSVREEWPSAEERYRTALEIFHGGPFGAFFEALVSRSHARALMLQERHAEAVAALEYSRGLFKLLGNAEATEGVERALEGTRP